MSRLIFINLPVADLSSAMTFYEAMGFSNNPHFTDATAACMVLSDIIHVMLLTHPKWASFTAKPIPAPTCSEVMLAISCADRAEVDDLAGKAHAAGGMCDVMPVQDLGFMYSRSFEDPDGHIWEVMWMDPAAVPPRG